MFKATKKDISRLRRSMPGGDVYESRFYWPRNYGFQHGAQRSRRGLRYLVNDIRRKASAPHLQAGASWGDSARKVAEAADVVFTSLPGPKEIEVALAEDGLLAGMRRGTAWFDLSTNSPTVVRRLHERFAAKGVAMLDSPVSGGPPAPEPQARPVGKRRQDRIRAP